MCKGIKSSHYHSVKFLGTKDNRTGEAVTHGHKTRTIADILSGWARDDWNETPLFPAATTAAAAAALGGSAYGNGRAGGQGIR